MEHILKILAEITSEPLSNTHFLERLENSATKLNKLELFKEYLMTTRLGKVNDLGAKEKLKHFQIIWNEFSTTAKRHHREFQSAHFKVKAKLDYYLNPLFLQGSTMRSEALTDSGKLAEVAHYLDHVFLDIVENYVWLKSSVGKARVDLSTLLYSMELLENRTPRNFKQIVGFLNLSDVGKAEAADAIAKAKKIISNVRKDRKTLIRAWFDRYR
jgi:hypothetical protein